MFPKGTACQLSVLAHQPKQVGQEVGLSSRQSHAAGNEFSASKDEPKKTHVGFDVGGCE